MSIIITFTHNESELNVIRAYIAEVQSLYLALIFRIHFIPILIKINNTLQEFRERTGLKAGCCIWQNFLDPITLGLLTGFFY